MSQKIKKTPFFPSSDRVAAILESARKQTGDDAVFWKGIDAGNLAKTIKADLELIPESQLVMWLKKELPQTCALVICLAQEELGARLLKGLPESLTDATIHGIIHMTPVDEDSLQSLHEVILEMKTASAHRTKHLGGLSKVAEIVALLPLSERQNLMARLSEKSPVLESELQSRFVTLERLCKLFPKDLAFVLSKLHDRKIALALYREDPALCAHYLGVLSSKRQSLLNDELSLLNSRAGTIQRVEKEAAIAELVDIATQFKEQGVILFPWEEELA